ncbi:hypothetical protein Bca4012_088572 [Brassica carinata]
MQVNTQASSNILDCSDRNNSKYYVVVYSARFNVHDAAKNFLYPLNEGKIPKKRFNLRLAPEETSIKLLFPFSVCEEQNVIWKVNIELEVPFVILDEAITKLRPAFFWLGSGEIDLKLGVRTSEFIDFVKPFIVGVCFNNIIPVFHPNLTRSIRSVLYTIS